MKMKMKMICDEAQPLIREATRGELDPATRERVYQHLASCPACQGVADEERQLDGLLEQHLPQVPAPRALKRRLQARLPAQVPRSARPRWLAPLAAAALASVAALVLVLRPPSPQGSPLVAEAVSDHLRVVYRDRPVDIESGGPHQVKPWFVGRIDFALPSVFGGNDEFTLEGGSVGYYLDRRAAVLVYKTLQHRASLFVFRAEGLSFPRPDRTLGRVPATLTHARGFSVILWRDGELGYALVADLNADELIRLAAHVASGS
jgi:anti-sigma factor RsiW